MNSKFEIRNPKQTQMIKKQKIPNKLISDFNFFDFGLSVSFVSNFVLRILIRK